MDKYIRHFKAWQRLGIILADLSILFNTFLPLAYFIPQKSFAIDEQPTPVPTEAPLEVVVEVPTLAPVETPTPTGVDAVDTPAQAPTETPVEVPTETPSPPETPSPTETPVEVPTETPVETPTVAPASEPTNVETVNNEPASSQPVEPTKTPVETPTEVPAPTPTVLPTIVPVSVVEQICLNPATVITDSSDSAWTTLNDSSVTIDNVQLGVRYTFPLEKKVSVTFTCLPLDPSLRSKLTIEQVKVADLNLPDSVNPATEYAYDITTDMAGGLFKYDVTLPKVNNTTAEVSYISKTIDQVKNSTLNVDEIKSVNSADINQQTETVQATDLNHFTIFIATYSTSSFSTTKTVYTQGETVYANSTGLTQDNGIYYRIDIINPSGVPVANSSCSKNISSLNYSYPTTISDPLGTTWKAEITQYGSNPDCNSKTNKTDTGTAVFELQASAPTSTPIPTTTPIISPVTTVSSSCMGVLDTGLTCTANDVSLADVTGITILDDGCQFPGDYVTFKATWDVQSNANRRYDIGLWFATGGQSSALYGSCSASSLPNSPIPPWFDYDQDACGDIESSSIVNPEITLTVRCLDSDSNNALNLPYCTSWQQNAGNVCNGPLDTLPGAPSKCNCEDGFQIPINVPYGAKIEVVKNLIPTTDAGRFNLQIGSSTMASNVGHSGTTGQVTVGAGTSASPGATHTVGETAYTGTNLSDYQSSITCVKRGTNTVVASSTDSGPLSVTVQKDDDILCTITNSLNLSTLTIEKTVVNNNGGTAVESNFNVYVGTSQVAWDTSLTLTPSTYTVSESTLPGYSASVWGGDCAANGSVTLLPGNNKTCTITNDDQSATLIVRKVVTNDNGGLKAASDFTFSVNSATAVAFETDGQNNLTVDAGTYSVTEPTVAGYSTTYDNCTGVVIANGGTATCTITNDDVAPRLHLRKIVTNNSGGGAVVADFTLTANGTGSNDLTGTSPVDSGSSLKADTFTLSETTVSGYTSSSWVCVGGTQDGSTITLGLDQEATCTITNDDQPATLIVKKVVVNDNGGLKAASDFTFSVNSATAVAFETDGQNNLTVDAGTYSVTEPTVAGYSTTYDNCSNLVIPNGGTATCTITNDDVAPILTFTKLVNNSYGGTLVVADFPLFIDSNTVTSGTPNTLLANRVYTLSETQQIGYTGGYFTGDCNAAGSISLAVGDNKTCTITNYDVQPKLTVTKVVINDDGGTQVVTDFPLFIDATSVKSGAQTGLNAGTYTVSETNQVGYTSVISGDCDANGSVTLSTGDVKSCTITNDDVAPQLTLVKTVTNDNGGNKVVSDFNLYINGTPATSGTTYPQLANTLLTATEDALSGYSASTWGGDCATDGTITLLPGDNKTCTITNDDVAPTLKLTKIVINDNGGDAQDSEWNLSATGSTNSFTESGDSVTFHQVTAGVSYDLSESGPTGYTSSDWVCDGGTLVEGAITLNLDQEVTCTITNDDIAPKLTVVKTVVNDNEGTKTVSDFNLYSNASPVVSGVTNEVMANTLYTLTEDNLSGYSASSWGGDCATNGTITLSPGEEKTCTITNDDTFGKVIVTKFNDKNNNGVYDEGDEVLPDWKIKLTGNGTQDTDDAGQAIFSPVLPGAYGLSEIMQTGWQQTAIYCEDDQPTPTPTGPTSTPTTTTTPSPTATPTPTTGGGICHWNEGADKWNALSVNLDNPGHVDHSLDFEYDGPRDSLGHPAKDAQNKDDPTKNGDAWCTENNPNLSLIDQLLGVKPAYAVAQENDDYQINLEPSQTLRCYVGNKFVQPKLNISKFNNRWPNSQSIGSEVTYTIEVEAVENDVQDITVTDLPPLGFIYKNGSYHVEVDGSPRTITEPQYNSPGRWFIGNLAAGQVAVLTYIATISDSVDPGLYKDMAWAFGCTNSPDCQLTSPDKLLATSVDSGHIDPGVLSNTFVGTKINLLPILANNDVNIENKIVGQVLGITSLPATGANPLWLLISLLSISIGLLLLKKSKKI